MRWPAALTYVAAAQRWRGPGCFGLGGRLRCDRLQGRDKRAIAADLSWAQDRAINSAALTSELTEKAAAVTEIRLTPTGHLRWEALEGQAEPAQLVTLRRAFVDSWREGLFTLAAEKIAAGD